MLPEKIIPAFKNEASFVKLEKNSKCSYYLERKIETSQETSLTTWNLSDKFNITHKEFTTCSTQNSNQIYFLNIN